MITDTPPPISCEMPPAIMASGGIYVGEMHGTQETPAVVLCLVKDALKRRADTITVSLEMPAEAARPDSDFWKGQDGRASVAMKALVAQLQDMAQKEPRLVVDFHAECGFLTLPTDFNAAINACYGNHLAAVAPHGFLIAYSGNFHAYRTFPPGLTQSYKPAGSYLLANIKNVDVVASDGGTYWNNSLQIYGAIASLKTVAGFKEDTAFGYDYVYVIKSFTASPPVVKRP